MQAARDNLLKQNKTAQPDLLPVDSEKFPTLAAFKAKRENIADAIFGEAQKDASRIIRGQEGLRMRRTTEALENKKSQESHIIPKIDASFL